MPRRRSRKPRAAKPIAYSLLLRADHASVYKALDALIKAHHEELATARIALAFCTSWRADPDGRHTIGRCKRASDLDRELAAFDFVILLQQEFWTSPNVTNAQRDALLDHELCHATVKRDPVTGDPLEDERGRIVYRLRKHDLEEFAEIAARHGTWKRDLEIFAQALARAERGGEQGRLPIPPAGASLTH